MIKPLILAGLFSAAWAQLSGDVGVITTSAAKAAVKVCSILDYGGVAGADGDIGAALTSAWNDCKTGGQVLIPEGDYGLATWVLLKSGTGVSINIEGTIYRTGTDGGNMIFIRDSSDLEIYSASGKGAIQGYGYEFLKDGSYGPRILRLYKCDRFAVHDLALVDSPAFHFSMDTCTNGEVYNLIIHGGAKGGLDGIDVWGTNIWIHDVEVSNKDECVTVKNPSSNLLIESIHCNQSGGCAMGSLATDTDIHDVVYSNVYTHGSNQMYMIKSNGGSGTVENIQFNNFWGHSNAYSLDFDTQWSSMSAVDGDGIAYSNISFSGWRGTCADGVQRGPVKLNCPAAVPCTDITVEDFSMWTESGSKVLYSCNNAYGEGACMREVDGQATAYSSTVTVTTATDYAVQTMDNELASGWPTTASIPIPTLPASFFPGIQPKSAVLGRGADAEVAVTSSALGVVGTTITTSSALAGEQTPVFETLSSSAAIGVPSLEASSSAPSKPAVSASDAAPAKPEPTGPISHCKRHMHKRH